MSVWRVVLLWLTCLCATTEAGLVLPPTGGSGEDVALIFIAAAELTYDQYELFGTYIYSFF